VLACIAHPNSERAERLLEDIAPPEEAEVHESKMVYTTLAETFAPEIRMPPPSAEDSHSVKRVDDIETLSASVAFNNSGASAKTAPPAPPALHL
jgi:hypothetical protein